MNTFGEKIRLTTFGESHGSAIGAVLDGLPSGFSIDIEHINAFLARRKPDEIYGGTSRKETDSVQFLSGLKNYTTTGAPVAFLIENKHQQSTDYDNLSDVNRPSHADFVYRQKYGIYHHEGGGRASARETATRVVAGSIATQMLAQKQLQIGTFISQIGSFELPEPSVLTNNQLITDDYLRKQVVAYLEKLREDQNSVGGVISCRVHGMPVGLGEPLYGKLNSKLAAAMFSINAVKGFDIGAGFNAASMTGMDYNDQMTIENNKPEFLSNHDGGIQAGISNGNVLSFRVAFKPPSSIGQPQQALTTDNEIRQIRIKGRHDSCIVPRAAVVVESMTALVLLDMLMQQSTKWGDITI
ncbi:MAG: chorismate synthase [Salinivirgaceae bacterium]|nr:chorismate synthase [Salinivirgaceae bacterium]